MSFVKNDIHQMSLTSPVNTLTEREKKFLKNSWAEKFREGIFPHINEERFSVLYSDNPASRPNTPVNVTVGSLIIKEMADLTDPEIFESMMFDIRFQYALITENYDEQPMSKNTLSNFRSALYDYYEKTGIDLIEEEVNALSQYFADDMEISGQTRRMDSVMISTSSRNLSRLEIIFQCVKGVVKQLIKKYPEVAQMTDLSKYLKSGYRNEVIYREKDASLDDKMRVLLEDAITIFKLVRDYPCIIECEEYKLFERMMSEQAIVSKDSFEWKDKRTVPGGSLQTPADPDATYRRKAGKDYVGYVGNIVEVMNDDANEDESKVIIIDYDLQQNSYSDPTFSKDVINSMDKAPDDKPIKMIVDGAYYSEEIDRMAKEKNILLIPVNLTGRKGVGCDYDLFEIDRVNHEIIKCPAGFEPEDNSYTSERYNAHISKAKCEGCVFRDSCPIEEQKRKNVIRIYDSTLNLWEKKREMGESEYWEMANRRAGIEGIPSVLRRRYGIDNMPIRGQVRSKIWYGLKIAAINSKRWMKYASLSLKQALLYFCWELDAIFSKEIILVFCK